MPVVLSTTRLDLISFVFYIGFGSSNPEWTKTFHTFVKKLPARLCFALQISTAVRYLCLKCCILDELCTISVGKKINYGTSPLQQNSTPVMVELMDSRVRYMTPDAGRSGSMFFWTNICRLGVILYTTWHICVHQNTLNSFCLNAGTGLKQPCGSGCLPWIQIFLPSRFRNTVLKSKIIINWNVI